jgi:hypothetical protein
MEIKKENQAGMTIRASEEAAPICKIVKLG